MIASLTQRVSAPVVSPPRFSRSLWLFAITIAAVLGSADLSPAAETTKPDGQMVSRNEEAKAELFYYVEFKAVTPGQTSNVKGKTYNGYSFSDVDLGTGTAPDTNTWLTSSISKIENEISINKTYKLPALTTINVERYRYRLMAPSGYETYFRVADTNAAFQPGSILEETPSGAGFEVVLMPINQSGALPGKSTAVNPTDGSISFALGFLTNGRSAGFLDLLPKIDYQKDAGSDGVSVWFGRALSSADLNCVRLNEKIEVISMTLPPLEYSSSTSVPALPGVRQVIAPQTVVDISRDGFDLVIKFYHPTQRNSRISSEANPYGGATVNYPASSGPFTFTGDPVLSYRITWANGVETVSTNTTSNSNGSLPPTVITTKSERIYSNLSVTRTEGSDVKTATVHQQELVGFTAEYEEWYEDIVECGECFGFGETRGEVDCLGCSGQGLTTCADCRGSGKSDEEEEEEVNGKKEFKDCSTCNGAGNVYCTTCGGDGQDVGWVECPNCEGEAYFSEVDYMYVPSSMSYDNLRTWAVNGFGVHTINRVSTAPGSHYNGGIAYQAGERPYHSHMTVSSHDAATGQVRSTRSSIYEGGFPAFRSEFVDNTRGSLATYSLSEGTQKVKASISGSNRLLSLFSYYRLATTDPRHATHHGRLKWRRGPDGSWEMLEYSEDPSSLGQVTRVVRSYLDTPIPGWPTNSATGQGWEITATGATIVGPNLDTTMPATIPSGESIAGMRVTNTTYTTDWEGVKRLPAEVIETADGQRVGHVKYGYTTETANSQPVWVSESWTYPNSASDNNNSAALYSRTKVYQGRLANGTPVAPWLQGLPYSSESPDGSKVSMAYTRGTWNAGSKTFTPSANGAAFRAVALKGSARSDSGGALTSTYDGTTIDSLYLSTNFSTASVTIRDANANTVRTETRIYGGAGWELVGAADMQYDVGGNLIRREELNGGLYEAVFTDVNGSSTAFSAISFNNGSGTRTGRKEYERDAQGLITKFYYDTEGRVEKTVRLATPACAAAPSGVPAITTVFEYDIDNRITKTTLKGTAADGSDDLVSTKTYDTAGQITTESSQGLTTSHAQTVVNGIVTSTTTTLPGGATRIQTSYLDGRPKAITGTAAPAQYFTYDISSGREVTTTHLGSSNSSRWSKTYADWADRTVQTDSSTHNGTAPATLTSTSEYNSLGQLIKASTPGLAPSLYNYDAQGVMTRYGLDLDATNTLAGTTDRINRFAQGYRHDGNVWERYGGDTATWWEYSETFAYPDGDSTGQTLTRNWSRMTNFARVSRPPGIPSEAIAIAEAVAADVHGNRSVTQKYLDRATGTMTTVVHAPFAAQPTITIAVAGRVVSQTSSASVTTTFKYDSLGRPVKTIDRTSTGYSGNNTEYYPGTTRVKSVTDNRSVRQHYYTYDAAGRVKSDQTPRINPATGTVNGYNTSYFTYDVRGQLTHIWGDVPYPVNYSYNTYGDRTEQRTYRDNGVTTNWSQADLATNGWPGSGDLTSYTYFEETGLLKSKTDAANKAVNYTYNALGQLKTRVWSRNISTTYSYFSGTGALQKTEYSDGTPAIEYTYDRLGRTKTVRDAAGDRTFTYRSVDLKPDAELFGRNGASTVTNHLLGTARQLTYQYDPANGRFVGADFSHNGSVEQSVSYGFDPVSSRLKTISSGAGVFRYSYTPNSNLIASVTRGSFTQARTYEANRNNLDTLSTSTQAGVLAGYDYTSDDLGRRTSVEQSGALYAPYLAVNQIMKTVYGYNERDELTSSVTSTGAPGSQSALAGRNFGYAFDPIGNRTKEKLEGVEHNYTADALNRYTSRATPSYLPVSGTANNTGGAGLTINGSTLGSGSWRNNYFHIQVNKAQTGAGALQSIGFNASSGSNSQSETAYSLTRPTAESFTYDDDGNLTADSLWRYEYDAENRLKAMYGKVTDQTGFKTAVLFVNDYKGRRVSKTVWNNNGSAENPSLASRRSQTFFAWQGWSLSAEYDGNLGNGAINVPIRRFTFGIDLSGTLGGAGDIGGLLAIEDLRTGHTGTYLGIHDGNGNLTALADGGTGTLAAEYEYDPFGNVLRSSGAYGKENPFRFAGKYFDTETGLSYYGYRYYSASLGRFINRDPIGETGGLNIFSNANNDTANGWDYLGLSGYSSKPTGDIVELPAFVVTASETSGRTYGGSHFNPFNVEKQYDSKGRYIPYKEGQIIKSRDKQLIVVTKLSTENDPVEGLAIGLPENLQVNYVEFSDQAQADLVAGLEATNAEIKQKTAEIASEGLKGDPEGKVQDPGVAETEAKLRGFFSNILGNLPVVSAFLGVYELVTGREAITGVPTSRFMAALGMIPGGKILKKLSSKLGIVGGAAKSAPGKTFDEARREGFEKAGMTDPSKVQFTKVDPKTGTVVEFKGPNGAKVVYDAPHATPGPGHDSPHVGYQTGGKRSAGGTGRGNIPYDGPQHPSRSQVKGEGVVDPH